MEGTHMTALEQLAEAILDGRVRIEIKTSSVNVLGMPTDASIYIDVDPDGEDEFEDEFEDDLQEDAA
jgi:hypothetical protein